MKKVAGGVTTVFVYNVGGQLIAEYSDSNGAGTGGVSYLTADHLGSTRVVTDAAGAVKERHDYLPYGEEIGSYVSGRGNVGSQDYKVGDIRQKFTGYERDKESGLDYSKNRYYSQAQGRFTSTDPLLASAKTNDPQTWNRYTYVLNNPTIAIDPGGLATIVVIVNPRAKGGNGRATIQVFDRNGYDVKISGKDTNRADGLAIGAKGANRRITRADTPFGVYTILPNYNGSNENGTQGGTLGKSARGDDTRFGTGIITLTPVAGEVKEAGRDYIYLHGGPPLDDANQELKGTEGCVRCSNGDINGLIQTVNDLAAGGDPITNVFIGDAPYLNGLADKKDDKGNYLYPELRNAGFGNTGTPGSPPSTQPGDTIRKNEDEEKEE